MESFLVERRMDKILVSIIVPIYNVEKYLSQCISSILEQTYRNIEIILVDDGSSDSSGSICNDFANKDKRIIVVHKENGGVSSARQVGIQLSSGDYILMIDGDDWIDKDTVDVFISQLQKNPRLDCILFTYLKEYPDNSYEKHIFQGNRDFLSGDSFQTNIYRHLFGLTNTELSHPESLEYLVSCCLKLYRAELCKNGLFVSTEEVGSGEDGIFNVYALQSCRSAVYIDKPLYHYRHNSNSITSNYRPKLKEQWARLFSIMQDKINQDALPFDFQEALNNRISLSVLGLSMNELDNPNGSFFQFVGYIRDYIHGKQYQSSISTMKLKELPLAWKILMFCCKYRLSLCTSVILKMIRYIKSKL